MNNIFPNVRHSFVYFILHSIEESRTGILKVGNIVLVGDIDYQ